MLLAFDYAKQIDFVAEIPEKTNPAFAYRDYLDAIARRDIEAVLDALTDDYGQTLCGLRRSRNFSAFFDLWCESQSDSIVMTGFKIKGDNAIVEARGKRLVSRICMYWNDGHWRIASERHLPVRHSGMV